MDSKINNVPILQEYIETQQSTPIDQNTGN